jgi:hypothetical protein
MPETRIRKQVAVDTDPIREDLILVHSATRRIANLGTILAKGFRHDGPVAASLSAAA